MTKKLKNRKSFYLILFLLPLVLLILLEVSLRISGFGTSFPLFIPAKSMHGYLQPNPDIINRYFSHIDLAPNIQPDTFFFKQKKQANSFRIVIQGGSTAAGFPFGRFGSLHGMLQQRFKRIFPELEIEIISTAMSAINSYTLLDFTDEIVEINPDLILIYAGHNEYVGIMGVGSAFAVKSDRAATLMFLKLRELRLFQLMQKLVGFFQQSSSSSVQTKQYPDKRTLMAQIAKEKNIPLNSELFNKGVEQFSQNLDLILSKYQAAEIPVMISTLASNEKDQPPFSSSDDKTSADGYYQRAKQLAIQRKSEQALQAYIKAKDNDLLRFRAPSRFNQIIRQKADRPGIILVDVEQRFRNESKQGIIGFEHMLEHLHPNARGYFLLAESFVEEIIAKQLIPGTPQTFSVENAWHDIPLTKIDLIAANFKIKTLTSDYPFKKTKFPVEFGKPKSFEDKLALEKLAGEDWLKLHQKMLDYYQRTKSNSLLNNKKEAAKVAGLIFDAFPNQHKTAWVAGQLYFALNDINLALYYHLKATELAPTEIRYLMSCAHSLFVNNRVSESLAVLDKVLKIDATHSQATNQKIRLENQLNNIDKRNTNDKNR